ncbi:hypothetical protein BCR33DRAFT_461132 [Rhizoclosmatium globosum]|uniref:Uncharacterized protein n=1 Tax=Rhizoclosmatium globosum TaxID=329046 RepID=A0A1Y2CXA3_9FUNG|nr:hypothetical protein BCR33DRAFT_461132 [Rhizoclosmatium globosum]|eukprot:ORY51650.1 hypothetical protein BCR33DRAFT_461132 [Rhizoclosmatium globosum]
MILSSTRHIIRIIYGIKQGLSLVPNVTETTPVTTQLPDHLLPLADSDVTPFSPFPQSSRPSRMPSSRVSTSTHTRSTSIVAPVTPVAKEYRRSTLSDMINQDATEDIAKQSEEKDIEAGSSQDGGSTGDESAAAGESGDELEVVQQQRQRRQERKRRALKSGDEENDDEEDARARQRSSNRKEMRGGTRSASRRRRPMSIDRVKRTEEESTPVPLGSSLSSSVKASATLDLSASFTESDFKLPSLSATSDSTKSINYPIPLPLLPHSDSISSFTSKQSRKTTPPPPPPQPTSPDDPTHIDPLTTALKTWRTLLHIFIHTPLSLTYILAKSRILSFTPPPRLQAHTSTAAYTLQRTRTLRRWAAVVWCLVISADAAVWARKVWRIVKALVVVRRQVQLAGRGSGRRVSSVGMGGGDGGVYGVEEFLADVVGGRGVAGLSQLMQSLRRGGGNVGGEAGGGQSLEVKMLVSEMEGLKREVRRAGLALLAVVGDFPAAFGGCFLGSANLAGREGLVALADLANDYEGRQAVDEVAIRSGVFPLWFTALGAFAASLAAWRLRAKDGVVVDSL